MDDSVDLNIQNQQLEKMDILIESGIRQVNNQNEAFNIIDKKLMWLFTIITGTQIFLINSYYLPKYYNFYETKSFLLTLLLILGIVILGFILHNVNGKNFDIGPGLDKQKEKFGSKDKTVFDLKLDTLQSYKNSVVKNNETIRIKSRNFRISMYLTFLYYIILVIYLIIYKTCAI